VNDWGPFAEPPMSGGVVLVEGSSFAVCSPGGDMRPTEAEGLFVQDARALSGWQLEIDDHRLEALRGFTVEPFAGVFVVRGTHASAVGEPTLIIERRRYVGTGMREDILVTNHSATEVTLTLRLRVEADFADLFSVKRGEPRPPGPIAVSATSSRWHASVQTEGGSREVVVHACGASADQSGLSVELIVPQRQQSSVSFAAEIAIDGRHLPPRFPIDRPVEEAEPLMRSAVWRSSEPRIKSASEVLQAVVARSEQDLSALQITDPSLPDLGVVAAGAPWYMALFGRDSLITSWLALGFDPDMALGTLDTLARFQGQLVDPTTEEEPGRILHEFRLGSEPALALGGAHRYYGSVDATPLFVFVLGELARWGGPADAIEGLLPAADAALAWIDDYGDRDGDGFVEYLSSSPNGLRNQGWKDSWDGINFADGRLAEPPIALIEVQGYVYGAFRARAYLARLFGDTKGSLTWDRRAETLKQRFNATFWLEERGHFAIGLDADKRPIDSLASNMGHALWSGVVHEDLAGPTARHLLSSTMFNGYGIRTLADSMGAYNPVSYHNGSVWPHDTALCVAGLARYGYREAAATVASALTDAAVSFAGRLPEVFCGFGRGALPGPVPYPTSCSPQAWASAAPLGALMAVLGLSPDVPAHRLEVAGSLPASWRPLQARVELGAAALSVAVDVSGTIKIDSPHHPELQILVHS
jgi:glycogen debranching enzyme